MKLPKPKQNDSEQLSLSTGKWLLRYILPEVGIYLRNHRNRIISEVYNSYIMYILTQAV